MRGIRPACVVRKVFQLAFLGRNIYTGVHTSGTAMMGKDLGGEERFAIPLTFQWGFRFCCICCNLLWFKWFTSDSRLDFGVNGAVRTLAQWQLDPFRSGSRDGAVIFASRKWSTKTSVPRAGWTDLVEHFKYPWVGILSGANAPIQNQWPARKFEPALSPFGEKIWFDMTHCDSIRRDMTRYVW